MRGLLLALCFLASACATPVVRESENPEQSERLLAAENLYRAGQISEAERLFRSVREVNLTRAPRLAARAEWGLSFVAEKKGEDLQALAHVVSAQNFASSLPPETARAELPARKAYLLSKLGRQPEAERALAEAEQGLKDLLRDPRMNLQAEGLARLHFQMGQSLQVPLSEDNFDDSLRAFQLTQVYLLRAASSPSAEWSRRATQSLRTQLIEFWNFLATNPPSRKTADLREHRKKQVPRLSDLVDLLEGVKARAPIRDDQAFEWQLELQDLTEELLASSKKVLYSGSETTTLTQESRRLNSLRRGTKKAEPPAKASETPSSTSPDPNL